MVWFFSLLTISSAINNSSACYLEKVTSSFEIEQLENWSNLQMNENKNQNNLFNIIVELHSSMIS